MTADRITAAPWVQMILTQLGKITTIAGKIPASRWRQLLLLLIAIWICNSAARLFWLLVPAPYQSMAPVVPKMQVDTKQTSFMAVDLAALNDLFGRFDPQSLVAAPPPEEPAVDPENAPETTLNLQLQGVLASNNPLLSSAVIGESHAQVLYKIGEVIAGTSGVTLRDVADLWVILDNNGKPEKLWLYGEDGQKVSSITAVAPPAYRPEPADNVIKAEVTNEQLSDVKSIGDVVRFMVATDNGQMIGYKVRPGRKRELFDQVGLKNDDIVVSVNGIEVNEPQKVREVYQALKTATEANLEVMRDGSTQFIQIRMSSG